VSEPRVAVVYNSPVLPDDHPDAASEGDVVAVAAAVADALRASNNSPSPPYEGGALGVSEPKETTPPGPPFVRGGVLLDALSRENRFAPFLLAVGPPLVGVVARLSEQAPDLVFNLVEGFGGVSAGATHMTAVLELLGLPYTGSTVEALAVCQSKARAKALLRGHGLPTAPFHLVRPGEVVPGSAWRPPVVVKPDAEDGSLGIDQGSVVTDPSALADRVERLRATYGGAVLIETYLPGPEFNVGVFALPEPRALPVAQILFAEDAGTWPILTYAAKWDEGSSADLASPAVCPAPIERELTDRLGSLAVAAFLATGCRDYARIDLRLDDRGEPMILEVNPNPDIGPKAGLARAAAVAGWPYAAAISAIARQALGRAPRR
jgi:D-alanine-D-alanine ligase